MNVFSREKRGVSLQAGRLSASQERIYDRLC
jgi:hypothetical protein